MKKICLCLVAAIAFIGCNQKPEGFTINGTLNGELENGTQVFLKKIGANNQPVSIDTTTVTDGKFSFTGGLLSEPEMHYIFVDKLMGYSVLILENGEIEMTAQKDSLGFAKIEGTLQNKVFTDYLDQSRFISVRGQSIQEDLQKAKLEGNEVSANALQDEMRELQEEYKNLDLSYIKDHPDALISVLLLERAIASKAVPYDELQGMVNGLSPEILKTSTGKKVTDKLEEMRAKEAKSKSTAIGSKAPNFTGTTPDGKELALNDIMGKATLIDFWAAWCKPCRAENPNVVRVYEKYHDKGLNIVGVSLDKKAEDWVKAIADDGLQWNQISQLAYFDDTVAKMYNVDAIPAAFLLDENGVIVAKNLRGPELEAKVAELLK